MFKRLAAGLLLTVGMSIPALSLVAAPAGAAGGSLISADYGTNPSSSTTDPSTSQPSVTSGTKSGGGTGDQSGSGTNRATGPGTGAASGSGTSSDSGTSSGSGSNLAVTGTDVIGLVIVAFVLIAGGFLILRLNRRRSAA